MGEDGMMGPGVINLNEQWAAYLQTYGARIIWGSNSSQHFLVLNKLIIAGYKYSSAQLQPVLLSSKYSCQEIKSWITESRLRKKSQF